jgi:hypothetical protein
MVVVAVECRRRPDLVSEIVPLRAPSPETVEQHSLLDPTYIIQNKHFLIKQIKQIKRQLV